MKPFLGKPNRELKLMNKSMELRQHVEIIKSKDIYNWKRSVLIISISIAPVSDWSILSDNSVIMMSKSKRSPHTEVEHCVKTGALFT